MSKQNELTRTLTMIEVGKPVSEEQAMQLIQYVAALEELCDDADMDDYHGTEGWRHRLGMDN